MLLLAGVWASSHKNNTTTVISLDNDTISAKGNGATVDDNTVTISSAGSYTISGTLSDGQLVVDSDDEDTVELIFNGLDITTPLFINNAEKTVIWLASGTQNYLTDGNDYVFPDREDEPDAALFSKDDLVIEGEGTLTVAANYKNGIASKDNLQINGGIITVTAVKHALKGKDSITIADGTFTLRAGSDGMQSDNDEDADKGIITILGGLFDITSDADGIQAETTLSISGGDFTIVAGGGSLFIAEDSAKGLKAGGLVSISGGIFALNTADDTIHSNADITIDGGEFTLSTADDGIHADGTATINDGEITIEESYEGIEGVIIVINDGEIHLKASDDGINIAGGNDAPITGNDYCLTINGGTIVVDADGDGLDANGPTSNGNGAIDYDGTFSMNGGFLVTAGSSSMAQAPSSSSTQNSIKVNLSSTLPAQTLFHLETQAGDALLTFAPAKMYQSVVFSSPELLSGTSGLVYTAGSSSGTSTDGLYTDETYSGGTYLTSFTLSQTITEVGTEQHRR